jgi:hypothetical protein
MINGSFLKLRSATNFDWLACYLKGKYSRRKNSFEEQMKNSSKKNQRVINNLPLMFPD